MSNLIPHSIARQLTYPGAVDSDGPEALEELDNQGSEALKWPPLIGTRENVFPIADQLSMTFFVSPAGNRQECGESEGNAVAGHVGSAMHELVAPPSAMMLDGMMNWWDLVELRLVPSSYVSLLMRKAWCSDHQTLRHFLAHSLFL